MAKVYIITGAGISAESGIPTFRDAGGLWHEYDLDVVCNFQTWRQNFDLVHDFYNKRRMELANYRPNEAHNAIARWQEEFGADRVVSITTNVDNLLEQAGVAGTVHLHGNLTELVNTKTGEVTDIGYTEFVGGDKDVKPNVVFFGENAPEYQTLFNLTGDMQTGDVVIFIGMSFQVVPAEYCLPINKFIYTVNVNPDVTTNYERPFSLSINSTSCYAVSNLDTVIRNLLDQAD